MKNLLVTSSPHISSPVTTRTIMLDVIIALMPAVICTVIQYGLRALILIAVSAATCTLTEYFWCRIAKKKIPCSDFSAVVTGILLALNVPASLPVWQVIVGSIFSIAVVKQLFGGIGCNFINPALAGRIMMAMSFPTTMTAYAFSKQAVDIVSGATPLALIAEGSVENLRFVDMLLGRFGGVMADTCSLAFIIGGVYLVIRKVIKPYIPVSFMLSTLAFSALFGSSAPFLSLFVGGLMVGSIFMATDYVTSPYTNYGKVVFGIGCGLIASLIRVFGNSAEGVSYAIVLMNLVVPYINDFTRNKPFGGGKKA